MKAIRYLAIGLFLLMLTSCGQASQTQEVSVSDDVGSPDRQETSILIDGEIKDWDPYPSIGSDPFDDQKHNGSDLVDLKAFTNHRYFYLMVETPTVGPIMNYRIESTLLDGGSVWIEIDPETLAISIRNPVSSRPVPLQAEVAVGDGLELKVPLEGFGASSISRIDKVIALVTEFDSSDSISAGEIPSFDEADNSELRTAAVLEEDSDEGVDEIKAQVGPPHHVWQTSLTPGYLYRSETQIPVQVNFGPDGNLYIPDWTGRRIAIMSPEGNYMGDLGLWEKFLWNRDGPRNIVFDSMGTMYFSSHSAIYRMEAGGLAERLDFPEGRLIGGLAINQEDEVFISDRGRGYIYKLLPDGKFGQVAYGVRNAEFMAFGLDGTLYIGQLGLNRVVELDLETGERQLFVELSAIFPDPIFLAVDSEGDIWIRTFSYLIQVSPEGEVKPIYVDGLDISGRTYSALRTSAGIAFDQAGRLWITNLNSLIQRLDPIDGRPDSYSLETVQPNMEVSDIAVASDGTVIAYNENARQLLHFDLEGNPRIILEYDQGGRGSVAISPQGEVYLGLPNGTILNVNEDGEINQWAEVWVNGLISLEDGTLIGVQLDEQWRRSIVQIKSQGSVETLVSHQSLVNVGMNGYRDILIANGPSNSIVLYDNGTALLFSLELDGDINLLRDFKLEGIDPGVATMTVGQDGRFYLIKHGPYELWVYDELGEGELLAEGIYGDPWSMAISPDGSRLYVAESGAIDYFLLE